MRLMAETAKKARAEPGILSYEFYEENNVPNSFLVFIELLTKEDLVEHLESDYGQTFKATAPQLIVRNGDTRIFSISQLDFVLGF